MGGKVDPEKQCTAHAKHSGKRCKRAVVPGSTVCRFHGGDAPQVRRKAEKRLAREAAERAVASYGLPREVEPQEALLEELHRTAGHVAWLAVSVRELERQELYGPVGGSQFGFPRQEPHVWIRLYQEERKHFAEVAKICIAAGIEERRVRLAEDQARELARVVTAILTDLGHDLTEERTREVVRLRLLEGGKAA